MSVSVIALTSVRSARLEYPDISEYGLTIFTLNLRLPVPKYGTVGDDNVYVIEVLLQIVSLLTEPFTLGVGST